jgi:Xaa-Pro dipeptidase
MTMHAGNRARLTAEMKAAGHEKGVILLQGGMQASQYDTDTELVMRQESYFNYLFGVSEQEFFGAIDIETDECTLFMPRLPDEYAIWMGKIQPPSFFKAKYAVDDVVFAEDIAGWANAKCEGTSQKPLFLLYGLNTDSGNHTTTTANWEGIESISMVDKSALHPVIANSRVCKSPEELELMR